MKIVMIFLFAVALTLFHCWTADGHNHTGKRGLQRKTHHRGHYVVPHSNEKRLLECTCVPRNPHHLQRKRRHMSGAQKRNHRGRRCQCKQSKRNSELSIPLS